MGGREGYQVVSELLAPPPPKPTFDVIKVLHCVRLYGQRERTIMYDRVLTLVLTCASCRGLVLMGVDGELCYLLIVVTNLASLAREARLVTTIIHL